MYFDYKMCRSPNATIFLSCDGAYLLFLNSDLFPFHFDLRQTKKYTLKKKICNSDFNEKDR